MKIIFFCQYLFSRGGSHSGHTSLLRQFVPQLIERGFEVEVIALAGKMSSEAPCKVHVLQTTDHQSDWGLLRKMLFWMKVVFILAIFVVKNYRILKHSTLVTLTVGASFVLPLFFRHVFIWENVAYFEKRPVVDKLRLWVMSILNSIVVVPTETERNVLQKLSFPLNVKFVRNWFSPLLIKKSRYNNSAPLQFMSAGFLEDRKGFDLLIRSVDLVKSKLPAGVEFHIYGDGPERENLVELIKDHDLESVICLKGIRDGLEQIYCQYDIFILPSRLEGFPLVMIDSLACGLPCIAFNCPTGPGQIIESGVNGYLIENGNIHDLASAIIDIVNKEDISIYARGAIDSAKSYNIQNITDVWIEMISEVS
ncbi:MAG TPA: hypothetical protein DCR48_10775 [Flavobacteriales bacterium]|nr:hypothetical protein [Flavobacteriales bacterium]